MKTQRPKGGVNTMGYPVRSGFNAGGSFEFVSPERGQFPGYVATTLSGDCYSTMVEPGKETESLQDSLHLGAETAAQWAYDLAYAAPAQLICAACARGEVSIAKAIEDLELVYPEGRESRTDNPQHLLIRQEEGERWPAPHAYDFLEEVRKHLDGEERRTVAGYWLETFASDRVAWAV